MLENIKILIANNKLLEAIESLQQLCKDSNYEDELISYLARYNDLHQRIRFDTLSASEVYLIKNKLAHSLLALVKEIEKDNSKLKIISKLTLLPKKNLWLFSITLVLTGIALGVVVILSTIPEVNKTPNKDSEKEVNIELKTEGSNSPAVFGKEVEIRYGGDFSEVEEKIDSVHMTD